MADWRRKYRLTWAMNACVGYKQSRIVFYSGCRCGALVCIDQAVWECPVPWITVFPSLPQSVIRASSSAWCYYWVIRLPSFPASATAVDATTWGGKEKKGLLFFFVRAFMCAYMAGCRDDCAWDSTMWPFFTKKCNKWTSISQAAGVMKNISDVRDLYFCHPSINESNISSHKSTHLPVHIYRLQAENNFLSQIFIFPFPGSSVSWVF